MILLIAVYQPGPQLGQFLAETRRVLPAHDVVIVDDGSTPAVGNLPGCTVLRHDTNRGKGAALRTGLRHIAAEHPGEDVLCSDPDGQHEVKDVQRVAEHLQTHGNLILGVRQFDAGVPLRNRFGNKLTCTLFHAATGREVRDTQTGLRGLPAVLIDWLLTIPGDHYEYEMSVLLRAAEKGLPIDQIPITTTYHKNGKSHFGSITDSVRIYRPLLRHASTRLIS